MDFENIKNWKSVGYERVVRDDESYIQTERLLKKQIADLVSFYEICEGRQSKRLIRDQIDFCLRRFHGYSIKQRIGAHYRQVEITGDCVFEHLIPASSVRDFIISKVMPIEYALHSPTVILSRENDKMLRVNGLGNENPEPFYPFRRYINAGITSEFQTFDGDAINNLNEWSLQQHYEKFLPRIVIEVL